jgi:integrase
MGELFRKSYRDKATGDKKLYPKWYGDYVDADGVRQRVPLARDKAAATQMLGNLERQADRVKAGLHNPIDDHAKASIADHLKDWERSLADAGGTVAYVRLTLHRCRIILDATGVAFLGNLSASKIAGAVALASMQERWSPSTKSHAVKALRRFGRWLQEDERWPANLFLKLSVPAAQVRADLRHERRAFTDAELATLFDTTMTGRGSRGLSGPDRVMLYRTAVSTGLRVGELASLTTSSFRDGWVSLPARATKNKHQASLPIPAALWADLSQWLITRKPNARCWGEGLAKDRSVFSKMLKADMEAARAAWIANGGDGASDFLTWQDRQGRFCDGHSFRTTFISNLVSHGATPAELQHLARHSDPATSLRHYAKVSEDAMVAAVGRVPVVPLNGTITPKDNFQNVPKRIRGATGESATPPIDAESVVPLWCRKPDKTRQNLTVVEHPIEAAQSAESTVKQGVLSRKQEVNALGIEPRTYGLKDPCHDGATALPDNDLGKPVESVVPLVVPLVTKSWMAGRWPSNRTPRGRR